MQLGPSGGCARRRLQMETEGCPCVPVGSGSMSRLQDATQKRRAPGRHGRCVRSGYAVQCAAYGRCLGYATQRAAYRQFKCDGDRTSTERRKPRCRSNAKCEKLVPKARARARRTTFVAGLSCCVEVPKWLQRWVGSTLDAWRPWRSSRGPRASEEVCRGAGGGVLWRDHASQKGEGIGQAT